MHKQHVQAGSPSRQFKSEGMLLEILKVTKFQGSIRPVLPTHQVLDGQELKTVPTNGG